MFKLPLLMSLVFATSAMAQSDFPLKPSVEGRHPLRVEITSNEPLSQLCIDRVDVSPPLELICVGNPESAVGSVIDLLVPLTVTPGDDAEIRARVVDMAGNTSIYSPNAAIADFTKPSAPILLLTP